jgi:hypothetical protein
MRRLLMILAAAALTAVMLAAQLAREVGNGAALAAQYMLALVRTLSLGGEQITPDVWHQAWQQAKHYIDDQVAGNRVDWRSRLRGSGNPQVAKWIEICLRLNPLQAQIVQEMRQNALTAAGGG